MVPEELIDELVRRFGTPDSALVLTGSHARGEAGSWSDIDLVRLLPDDATAVSDDGSYLIDGNLVVLSSVTLSAVNDWFTQPEQAVAVIEGLRCAMVLSDPTQRFSEVQARAKSFVWDDSMRRKADAWVLEQMVGWVEEVHKGIEGIRRNDPGRLLNSRFGLSWGLVRVLIVRHGLLLTGDNTFLEQLKRTLTDEALTRLIDKSFGITADATNTLIDQVRAGLELYVRVAELVGPALIGDEGGLVRTTSKRVNEWLAGQH